MVLCTTAILCEEFQAPMLVQRPALIFTKPSYKSCHVIIRGSAGHEDAIGATADCHKELAQKGHIDKPQPDFTESRLINLTAYIAFSRLTNALQSPRLRGSSAHVPKQLN